MVGKKGDVLSRSIDFYIKRDSGLRIFMKTCCKSQALEFVWVSETEIQVS